MFKTKMEKFVESCLYNKPNIADAKYGQIIQKIIDGIYKSAESGKEVKIK